MCIALALGEHRNMDAILEERPRSLEAVGPSGSMGAVESWAVSSAVAWSVCTFSVEARLRRTQIQDPTHSHSESLVVVVHNYLFGPPRSKVPGAAPPRLRGPRTTRGWTTTPYESRGVVEFG